LTGTLSTGGGTRVEVIPALRSLDGHAVSDRTGQTRVEAMRVVAACTIGAGIALSGFPPVNNIAADLHVDALPGFALATPAVLLAGLAVWMGRRDSDAGLVPAIAAFVIGLLCLGAGLSLTVSRHASDSLSLLVLGILAPACVFLGIRRGGLPLAALAGSFLTALSAALLWADLVFVQDNGLPTPAKLFAAKFTDHPHDFHYFTLGNPDHTATFLLLPLTFCLVWVRDRNLTVRGRRLVILATAVLLLTILLLYVRLPMIVAFGMLLVEVLTLPLPRRARLTIVGFALLAAAALVVGSPSHYLTDVFSTAKSTSGRVRINSVSAGLHALEHHLLTGVGLGQYGAGTSVPAHSSVIQAGAEMGLVGVLGLGLLTIALPIAAIAKLRRWSGDALGTAALVAVAVYVVMAAVSAGADDGLFVGLVSIYGLTLGLFAGIGLAPTSVSGSVSFRGAFGVARATAAARLRHRVGRWLSRERLAWFGYGIAWTPIAILTTAPRLPAVVQLSGSRLQELNEVIIAHQHGFGPLVDWLSPGHFYPAGLTDDQGSYLVTPWLSDLLHTSNVSTIIRTVFLFGVCAIVATYPVAIRRLTGSRLAALTAPLLVLGFFRFLTDDGFYWVPAATLAMCLPWLLVFVRERTAPAGPVIVIGAIAGLSQLFRSQTGLGLLIGAAVVCLLAPGTWQRRAVVIALIALAYVGVSGGTIDLALQARAARMQAYPLTTNGYAGVTKWSDSSGHPFWHTVYIGLGVVRNPYGISYSDQVAAAYVRSVDPLAPFVSSKYESILEKRVLHLVVSNPGFILRAEKRKAGEVLADGLSRFWPLLLIVPLALLMGLGRMRRKRYSAVFVPAAVVAVLPPLVAIPRPDYEMPWLGLLAATGVLSGCWLVGAVGVGAAGLIRESGRQQLIAPWSRAVARWNGLLTAIAVAVRRRYRAILLPVAIVAAGVSDRLRATAGRIWSWIWACGQFVTYLAGQLIAVARSSRVYVAVAVVVAGLFVRGYLESWQKKVTEVATPVATGTLAFDARFPPPVRSWKLGTNKAGWTIDQGVTARPGTALSVVTSGTDNAYQLMSPVVALKPGTYVAAVRGEVQSGGMAVGVLDAKADKWIQVESFYSGKPPSRATMPDEFRITTTKRIQIILSDESISGPSIWKLSQVLIAPPVRAGTPSAQPLPSLTLPAVKIPVTTGAGRQRVPQAP
jgi:O-Antigen ligase